MKVHQCETVRLTAQRQAVLDAVLASRSHPTAAEIYDLVRERQPRIAFGTVYNALHVLAQAGLIVEHSFGDRASRFDGNVDRHDHVLCVRCGALRDVDLGLSTERILEIAGETGYQVRSHHVELRGLCPECSRGRSVRSEVSFVAAG